VLELNTVKVISNTFSGIFKKRLHTWITYQDGFGKQFTNQSQGAYVVARKRREILKQKPSLGRVWCKRGEKENQSISLHSSCLENV